MSTLACDNSWLRGCPCSPLYLISCHCPHSCFFSYQPRSNTGWAGTPLHSLFPWSEPSLSLPPPYLSTCYLLCRLTLWYVLQGTSLICLLTSRLADRPFPACSYPFLGILPVILSPSTRSCSFQKAETCDLCSPRASRTPGALYLAVK